MLRRGFLTALIGAPLVAKSAAEELVYGGGIPVSISSSGNVGSVGDQDGPSRAWRAFEKIRNRENRKRDALLSPLPPHIAAKKSWSETYKRSVAVKEALEFQEKFGYHLDDQAIEAVLRKLGVSW